MIRDFGHLPVCDVGSIEALCLQVLTGHRGNRESAVKAMLLCFAIYSFFQVFPCLIGRIAEVAFQDGVASALGRIHIQLCGNHVGLCYVSTLHSVWT